MIAVIFARLGWWWCRTFHEHISRPANNHYVCWECGRRHRIMW